MTLEVKLNIIACLAIFFAITCVTALILFDKKNGGNALNSGSYKTESSYFIANKNGEQTEVTEDMWNKSLRLAVLTFCVAIFADICFLYLLLRYIGIPIVRKYLQILFNLFKKL